MAEIDVVGVQSVCALMEQIGLKRFSISRPGQHKNVVPVYECLKTNSVAGAVDAFKSWATNMLNGSTNTNAYELLLFDNADGMEPDETGEKKKRATRVRFIFALSQNVPYQHAQTQQPGHDNKSVAELVQLAVSAALAERDKQDLKKELAELRARLDDYEQDDDDEQDDDNGNLGAIAQVNQLLDRVGIFGKQTTALAGETGTVAEPKTPAVTPEQLANINKAVRILAVHDKDLDKDLLKLAALAENNPAQFKFLLNALRNL